MSKDQDRMVYRNAKGDWVNKRNDAEHASSVHRIQAEAEAAARAMLSRQGGGELTLKGTDRLIRSKDTIAPGKDPTPPRDSEY
ncbi:DUF2188 domain-containing protein [Ancylobacter sonchi]|uniref:DUF2188 domain-containing protein n=1 Tax=Ancylobacter sonchi TaxID=1937790 RepID=UPI001BD608B6|nr:DUF2188 domain-containing protein [Ancylobacter sonchi]MBS7535104.1 DUF2188 domain-containing protein [Ancylobacter sonchi]